MAGLAAIAAAAALLATPVGLLETAVASSGLSEALPAAEGGAKRRPVRPPEER